MKLNASQAMAVRHGQGPALIVAGPGSGKTAVIICRIHSTIHHLRVPAENILAVTFSRKAAENMKDRFLTMSSEKRLPFFGTFHSIFFIILRFAYHLTAENIITKNRKDMLILEAASSLRLEYEDETEFADCLLNEISRVKNGAFLLENFNSSVVPASCFRQIFHLYSRALKNRGLIDFDDMLSMCLKLLTERKISGPIGKTGSVIFWSMSFRTSIRSNTGPCSCWHVLKQLVRCRR